MDVDVTYVNFAFYQMSYLTSWRRSTSDSTCAFLGTSYDLLTIIIGIVYQLYISQYMYSEIFFKLRLSLRLHLRLDL